MRELFADLPEAVDNTLVVARRCACYAASAGADPAGLRHRGRSQRGRGRKRDQAKAGLVSASRRSVYRDDMDAAHATRWPLPYRERLDYSSASSSRWASRATS